MTSTPRRTRSSVASAVRTLKSPPSQSGLKPDECYLVGDQDKAVPVLAIEVVWTSGGIDKLEIYKRLGVGEVWFWKASRIEVQSCGRTATNAETAAASFPTSTSRCSARSWIARRRSRPSRPSATPFAAEPAAGRPGPLRRGHVREVNG